MPFFLRIPLPVMSCLPCLPVKLVIHNFASTRKLSLRELPILSFVLLNVLYCFRTYFFTCQSFLQDGALVIQSLSRVWLCGFMDWCRPGFRILYYLPVFSQIHVHWVGGAIQLSHSLSPSSPALNLSQHQGLFQWISSLHQVAKVLERQLHHQSCQWIFRVDFLWNSLLWSSCCPGNSQESSPVSQFKNINSSTLNLLYVPSLTSIHDYWKNHSFDYMDLCQQSDVSAF